MLLAKQPTMLDDFDDDDLFAELYDYEEEILTARRRDSVLAVGTLGPARARMLTAELATPARPS